MSEGIEFSPSRLREMREVRGLSQIQLAEFLSITNAAVSAYETGKSKPSVAVLEHLSILLNVPASFFLRPARDAKSGVAFYRSMHSTTKRARTKAEHRLQWLIDIVDYMETLVELPEVNIPQLSMPENPMEISENDIEGFAASAREFWGMGAGPVVNMTRLLENQGVILTLDRLETQALDSLTYRTADRPYVMLNQEKGTAVRWRYDAAHELGHMIMHAHLDQRTVRQSTVAALLEDQAHRFAGAFLLPLRPFSEDFYAASLDTLFNMKPKWRVSIGAMISRASKADLISPEVARRLWINHSRRGWKRLEPLDDQLEPEMPRTLAQSQAVILSEGHSAQGLRQAVALSDEDIESLCSLPAGYLAEADGPRVHPRGNVVAFPVGRNRTYAHTP
jgi:Zn-dependent peptidase ImmA (M78 family)/transcriptional regulator with XRE-family HTH domain